MTYRSFHFFQGRSHAMSWKDISLVSPADAAGTIENFSRSYRDQFTFLHEIPKGDVSTLKRQLRRDAVSGLIAGLPMPDSQRKLLLRMLVTSPEEVLRSLADDALRIGAKDVYEKIFVIRQSFPESLFGKVTSPRGMERHEITPIHFWIQLGKGNVPYLRVRTGLRSGTCSLSPIPRAIMKELAQAKKRHDADCASSVKSRYLRVSSEGRVYAVALESELQFLIPLSDVQRARYERASLGSGLMNGERIRFALAPMLHEIVCPMGLELPFDPYLAGGLIRDASPLDF